MTSKILPDQFLIENLSSYSGSYTDHYMYGNIFSSRNRYIDDTVSGVRYGILPCYPDGYTSSVDFSRAEIAYSTQLDKSYVSQSIYTQDKTMWFSDYIRIVHGRYLPSRTANYSTQFRDESEYYYDSYTPNIFNMYRVNGGFYASNTVGSDPSYRFGTWQEIFAVEHYSGTRRDLITNSPIEDFIYPEFSNSLGIVLTNLGTNQGEASNSPYSSVDDYLWRINYPLSIKYRSLGRSLKLSRELAQSVTVNVNVAASATMEPLTSKLISTVAIFSSGTRIDQNTYTMFNPWPNNDKNLQYLFDCVISGSEAEFLFGESQTLSTQFLNVFNRKAVARLSDVQNIFFCLGKNGVMHNMWNDGMLCRNFPEFHINSWFMTTAPIIRGYRYGLLNANPVATKAFWRRDHFGQFRDRLEQRQYSKFYYNGISDLMPDPSRPVLIETVTQRSGKGVLRNIIGQSPIVIKFVPDSQAALTASQYQKFDPYAQSITYLSNSRESGIYDFEYRSAIPFEDRDIA